MILVLYMILETLFYGLYIEIIITGASLVAQW